MERVETFIKDVLNFVKCLGICAVSQMRGEICSPIRGISGIPIRAIKEFKLIIPANKFLLFYSNSFI